MAIPGSGFGVTTGITLRCDDDYCFHYYECNGSFLFQRIAVLFLKKTVFIITCHFMDIIIRSPFILNLYWHNSREYSKTGSQQNFYILSQFPRNTLVDHKMFGEIKHQGLENIFF